jgi:hypothetical protein
MLFSSQLDIQTKYVAKDLIILLRFWHPLITEHYFRDECLLETVNNKRLSQNDHIPLKSATVSHHFHDGKTKKIDDEIMIHWNIIG